MEDVRYDLGILSQNTRVSHGKRHTVYHDLRPLVLRNVLFAGQP